MKQFSARFLGLTLALSLSACGGSTAGPASTPSGAAPSATGLVPPATSGPGDGGPAAPHPRLLGKWIQPHPADARPGATTHWELLELTGQPRGKGWVYRTSHMPIVCPAAVGAPCTGVLAEGEYTLSPGRIHLGSHVLSWSLDGDGLRLVTVSGGAPETYLFAAMDRSP